MADAYSRFTNDASNLKFGMVDNGDGTYSMMVSQAVAGTPTGAPNMTSGSVMVTSGSTLIAAARPTRRSIIIKNADASNKVYVGKENLAGGTAMELAAGESIALDYVGAIYGRCASGGRTIFYLETYD